MARSKSYEDILYHKTDGVAKVTINRPHSLMHFVREPSMKCTKLFWMPARIRKSGVVLLTGAGPHTDGKYAFCSGGDQSVRGDAGYVDDEGVPRLNVLDLQKLIRSMPKVVIALVSGYAIGGGSLYMWFAILLLLRIMRSLDKPVPRWVVLTVGSSYLARIVGQKKAREIWYLCRQYNAQGVGYGFGK